ncbi:hypothetical protein PFDG_03718 [Plasmodium falciparum Dd2]|uniref:Uncharacterized protein n=1 Tax=Plasmodium falciparum (isolate Dd2) TaxID=57267 RepID=A0A0L7M4S3_PLAF4|nr:hypothetical protein PFDG_03718 [Plasmodium falciparum Dd2]
MLKSFFLCSENK